MGSALMQSTNSCALKSSWICFVLCVRVYVRQLKVTRSRRWSRSTDSRGLFLCVMLLPHCRRSKLCLRLVKIQQVLGKYYARSLTIIVTTVFRHGGCGIGSKRCAVSWKLSLVDRSRGRNQSQVLQATI